MDIVKPKLALMITSILSFILLVAAIILQIYIDLEPCKLCIYQRWAWLISGSISLTVYLLLYKYNYKKILLFITSFAFAITSLISFYHVGVESNLWQSNFSCNDILGLETTNIKDLEKAILEQNSSGCKNPAFYIFGLSAMKVIS